MANILSKLLGQINVKNSEEKYDSLSGTKSEEAGTPFLCHNLDNMLFVSHRIGSRNIHTITDSE